MHILRGLALWIFCSQIVNAQSALEQDLISRASKMSDAEVEKFLNVFEAQVEELNLLKSKQLKSLSRPTISYRGGASSEISENLDLYRKSFHILKTQIFSSSDWDIHNSNAEPFIRAVRGVDDRLCESLEKILRAKRNSPDFYRARAEFQVASIYSMALSQWVIEEKEGGEPLLVGSPRVLIPLSSPARKKFVEVMIQRAAMVEILSDQILGSLSMMTSQDEEKTFEILYQQSLKDSSPIKPMLIIGGIMGLSQVLKARICKTWIKKLVGDKVEKLPSPVKRSMRWASLVVVLGLSASFAQSMGKISSKIFRSPGIHLTPYDRLLARTLEANEHAYGPDLWLFQNLNEIVNSRAVKMGRAWFLDPDWQIVKERWGSVEGALEAARIRLRVLKQIQFQRRKY